MALVWVLGFWVFWLSGNLVLVILELILIDLMVMAVHKLPYLDCSDQIRANYQNLPMAAQLLMMAPMIRMMMGRMFEMMLLKVLEMMMDDAMMHSNRSGFERVMILMEYHRNAHFYPR